MFVRTVFLIMIFLLAGSINAKDFSTSGQINFNQGKSPKSIPLTIHDTMQGKISLYHSKANHVDSLRGGFLLNNHSKKNVTLKYHVILKDSKGPIAQTKGSFLLKPGLQKVKMSHIVLHPNDIKNISCYEIKIN